MISLLIVIKAPTAYTLDSTRLKTFATSSQRRLRDRVLPRTSWKQVHGCLGVAGGRDRDRRPPSEDRTSNDLFHRPDDHGLPYSRPLSPPRTLHHSAYSHRWRRRSRQKQPGASPTPANKPPYRPPRRGISRERSGSYGLDYHDSRTDSVNVDTPHPPPPWCNMERVYRDSSRPSTADLAADTQRQLQPFSPSPPRSRKFDDPPGRYSYGPPPPSRDLYPSSQSPYPRRRRTAAKEDAYWKARASSPRWGWEGQPPPVDRDRERQSQRFNRDASLPRSSDYNLGRDFSRGFCLFPDHFLRYCIVLM